MELEIPMLPALCQTGFALGLTEETIDQRVQEYWLEFFEEPKTLAQLVRGVLE